MEELRLFLLEAEFGEEGAWRKWNGCFVVLWCQQEGFVCVFLYVVRVVFTNLFCKISQNCYGLLLGITLHCWHQGSINRNTLFFHQFGEELGDNFANCGDKRSTQSATRRNNIRCMSNISGCILRKIPLMSLQSPTSTSAQLETNRLIQI